MSPLRPQANVVVGLVVLAFTGTVLVLFDSPTPAVNQGPVPPTQLTVDWAASPAGAHSATGSITVSGKAPGLSTVLGPRTVIVQLPRGQLTDIPPQCDESSTITERSYITPDGHELYCQLTNDGGGDVTFTAEPDPVSGSVAGTAEMVDGPRETLPPHQVTARPAPRPELRLLSSPDFLNFDIGNLADGPNQWEVGRSANSTNRDYRVAIDTVLDNFKAQHPDEVLVAGDLVDGHWGKDTYNTGNFGPVNTQSERVKALDEAARTYYPQYYRRFAERGLDVRPAVGDHEMGDNPWPAYKRRLAATFRARFADYATRGPHGGYRYPDHPQGENRHTAYAWRPRPDVQMITLDVFDIGVDHARVHVDRDQLRWVHHVLAKAHRDGVKWIVVQGHVPIVEPVRVLDSSGLHYEGGTHSRLWHLFEKYHVNLYLCGEVHAVTATQQDGITQITHGGAFAVGLTNYLLLDFFHDHIAVTLRDFLIHRHFGPSRLWETSGHGIPSIIDVAKDPITIGTATLTPEGLEHRSGLLQPWDGHSAY